jgi:uroporphyrinogen decarboxylase
MEDIDDFDWPNPHDPGYSRGLRDKARYLYENTDYAIVAYLLYNVIHLAQYLRGFEDWFMDFVENPELSARLHEKAADIGIQVAEHFLGAVGEYCQIVLFADDVAGQDGLMIRPESFKEIIRPQWKRMFDFLRNRTDAKLCLHCCGNIYDILDDIVEIGVEVVNPVQVSHPAMDTRRLKQDYGDRLVFWGSIDTQRVLPFGSPEDVEKEVKKRIDDLAPGGGFILAPVHCITSDVSPENIRAMFDTAREYGRYRGK